MVSLGQILKMPQKSEEPLCPGTLELICEKKTARKHTRYSRNETILKIGHLAKATAHAKAIVFAQMSLWVKN